MDVREMLRQLRMGASARAVSRGVGVSRNTVRDYEKWFRESGFLPGDPQALPSERELAVALEAVAARTPAPGPEPRLRTHHDEIASLISTPLQVKVAWQRFTEAHPDVARSYTAFRRYVRRYVETTRPRAYTRIEVAAGAEAQVDFGYVGLIPRRAGEGPRKTWAFVMTLSHSRHQYVELVQDQTVATWLSLHRNAFQFFVGVPHKVLLDNLKAGIVKASITDPEVQRAYRECAEHYGFLISPCVARTPEHKGKVERGVQYVKRSFMAGRVFASLDEANAAALRWVMETAGRRVHGTTQEVPLEVFEQRERASLLQLPAAPFLLLEWKQAKLHPDCHVVFARSYYSAPHTLIGQRLWVRGNGRAVQLFHEHQLVATHAQSDRPGRRVTNEAHLPPEKLRYLMQSPTWCRERAAEAGPAIAEFIETLLGDRVLDRLRGAQSTMRLVEKHGAARVNAACRRALACGAVSAKSVKAILDRGLDADPLPGECAAAAPPPTPREYARTFDDVFNPAEPATTEGDRPWTSSIS